MSQLDLRVGPSPFPVYGVGNIEVTNRVGHTCVEFSPVPFGTSRTKISAIVLENILGNHPRVKLSPHLVGLTKGFNLADPTFHTPGPVDLLLGSDILGQICSGSWRALQPGGLVGLHTIFGMSLLGPILPVSTVSVEDRLHVGSTLSDAVQKFWEVEEPPLVPRSNPEDDECESFYQNNTGRLVSGQFVTRLPFLANRPQLGDSRHMAERRLISMERHMKRDSELRRKYIEFMREYEDLGHMSVSNTDYRSVEHYFLPHHAVLKSPGGKIRVVFDGSAPTTSGVSLNQCLHTGPKLHRDIGDILTGFRRHAIVFVADIRQMFRQTVIHRDDRRFQMILWREHPDDPMVVYELRVNTYGLRSSPFIAIRSLLELAERERIRFPRASTILKEDVYVDDCCTGAASVEEALVLRDELIGIMKAGGYELRKWLSNSPRLLTDLPEEHQQDPHIFQNADNPDMLAVLGVQYRPVQDVFTYQVDLQTPKSWCKRSVLSTVARTYDPNGWISPVIFWAKCFLQKLWAAQLSWDEPLHGELLLEWLEFVSSLPAINRVSLPRRFLPSGEYQASLHGFCDASERGYAAVVYLRSVDVAGNVFVSPVLAKSKVAPIRSRMTIPKLELSGATLLARLLNHVVATLGRSLELTDVFAWTDSQIVLCWLRASVHTLEVFVANRVSQIQASLAKLIWRHVPGELNPADCASRGCLAPEIIEHPLWWGPNWLDGRACTWPGSPISSDQPVIGFISLPVVESESQFDPNVLLNRYSSLDKLLNVTAWIKRWRHNVKNSKNKVISPFITSHERSEALLGWIRVVQGVSFTSELKIIKEGRAKLKGAIVRLNPFIDQTGLLRVGGRLRNANLSHGARHPLLLPKDGHLVRLLAMDRHIKNSHSGCNALVAILQREFWILSARRLVRGVIFRCMSCYRLKASTMQPQMGDLPVDRVSESRPFTSVGTDFAGPFLVKSSQLRNAKSVKAYLCVFVCLATKATHLEVVSALTTEAFVAALSRFVSRRGVPTLIRSDNGTNFQGTNNYLRDVYKFLEDQKCYLGHAMALRGITWRFDPPVCPHWGGIFEAVVKSAKTHLRRVIGETILTFEELTTVFAKVEAVLNSRPLCPLSSDPNDLEALTPGHLLIGQPLAALPEYPWRDVPINRLSRFQLLQQLTQSFWNRWHLEYLHTLQQRVKWTDKTNPPKVGDLVLIKDANLPPLCWRRGRIVKLFPGTDGVPRVAEVLVGNSVIKRAVATLSRLPIE